MWWARGAAVEWGATVNTTLCVQLISGQTEGERNGRGAVTIVELIVTGDIKKRRDNRYRAKWRGTQDIQTETSRERGRD